MKASSPPAQKIAEPSTWQRLIARTRRAIAPPVVHDLHLSSAATVNAHFWLSQFPWRITAGWSVAAALLAAGALWRPWDLAWRDVVLLWLLADPIWGSLWRLAAGRMELPAQRGRSWANDLWLPYLRPGSPAAQLLGGDGPASLPLLFRVALPGALVALVVASALGRTAVWMTATVMAITVVGWISARLFNRPPVFLHSVVMVGMPWLLTLSLFGTSFDGSGVDPQRAAPLILAALWTLHAWGGERAICFANDWLGMALMGAAQIGIGALLVTVRAPLWLAVLVTLWLPTWLTVYQRGSLARHRFWWLLAMLVSALAVGG
jgi:hypothetical protein